MLYQDEAHNGAQVSHNGSPQPCLNPPIKEEWIQKLDMAKLENLIQRHYLNPAKGICKYVIPRHPSPKGSTYIRVVWNFSKIYSTILLLYHPFLCQLMQHYAKKL